MWSSLVLPMEPAELRCCVVLAAGDEGEDRKPNESAGGSGRVRGVLRRVAARRGLARQDVGDVWPPRGSRALPRSATEDQTVTAIRPAIPA